MADGVEKRYDPAHGGIGSESRPDCPGEEIAAVIPFPRNDEALLQFLLTGTSLREAQRRSNLSPVQEGPACFATPHSKSPRGQHG